MTALLLISGALSHSSGVVKPLWAVGGGAPTFLGVEDCSYQGGCEDGKSQMDIVTGCLSQSHQTQRSPGLEALGSLIFTNKVPMLKEVKF